MRSPDTASRPSELKLEAKTGGMTAWLLQRISGLFLAYALIVHLYAVHVVTQGTLSWEVITARLQDSGMWTAYYLMFIPAVVYHALNGIWGILMEYEPPATLRLLLRILFWGGGLALIVYGYFGIRPLLGLEGMIHGG